jgi:transketolase
VSSKKTQKRFAFGPRRGYYVEINRENSGGISGEWVRMFDDYDLLYRSLCGILYNFVPKSGHPGGSISSGRIVEGILFSTMSYRIGDPECRENDLLSYAAGHKAMGLYAMWAMRNEVCRLSRPELLPGPDRQLRLEDMLGFRRNPTQETPLFRKYEAKPLDGHPTPLTPFVKLSTGASGVGVPTSFGLAFGAMDTYGKDAPFVHVLEGEGGMTPGRVSEALAAAATAQMWNIVMHVDWNQASIDSNHVCRDGDKPGEYVQWNPVDFCYLHDWNVILVEDGKEISQVLGAQKYAMQHLNEQPTAIVYRTVKGWQYGIEGRKSHGAGHDFCSDDFCETLDPAEARFGIEFPRFCGEKNPTDIEACFWDHLMVLRSMLEKHEEIPAFFGKRLAEADRRLVKLDRRKREGAPNIAAIYAPSVTPEAIPDSCRYKPGTETTLRGALGQALNHLNHLSGGAIVAAAADLLGSTSIDITGKGFPAGYFNAVSNPGARMLSIGGICEDAIGGIMAGISAFGSNIGAGSSYGAFIAALSHITARLHGIGQQAKHEYNGEPYNTWIIVCAHAGLKTGEDGPTHADPQALQLLQENFPRGVMITLTPWDPQEVYPSLIAALRHRPALVAPFVTRPNEKIFDRAALGLPPATAAVKGLYALRKADGAKKPYHGTLVLQESGVTNTFIEEVLPRIDKAGYNMNIFYVSSAELFDLLPEDEQQSIFPERLALEAMGITGLTMPTMMRWVASADGRRRTLHAFRKGHYLGSGQAHKVLEEAGLHGDGQWEAVRAYAEMMGRR